MLLLITDREAESLIRTRLVEAFPEDGFLGEESASTNLPGAWSPPECRASFLSSDHQSEFLCQLFALAAV